MSQDIFIPKITITDKRTPCKLGTISKHLLTPCRTLGLSRKIRTPKSNINTTGNPSESTRYSWITDITPVKKDTIEASKPGELPLKSNPKKRKSRENKSEVYCKGPTSNKSQTDECAVNTPLKGDLGVDCFVNTPQGNDESIIVSDLNRNNTGNGKENLPEGLSGKGACVTPQTSNDVQNLEATELCLSDARASTRSAKRPKTINVKTSAKRTLIRCLSTKKSFTASDDLLTDNEDEDFAPILKSNKSSFSESPALLNCSVDLERLPRSMSNLESSEEIIKSKTKDKCNKNKRVMYSSDEDDFVPSQNSTKSDKVRAVETPLDLEQKIHELETCVKEKETKAAKLKQAVIYHKLHNVEELKKLTLAWKTGSEKGLGDLLSKLQEHGPMDMNSLLRKLNVPSTMIRYDSEKACFL